MIDRTTAEARAYTVPLRAELEEPGARCSKRHGLHLIGLVERLCTALDEARAELRRRDDLTIPYDDLASAWNALANGLHELGISVASRDGETWDWAYRGRSGSEPTRSAAFLAALRSAELHLPDDTRVTLEGVDG